MSFHLIHGHSHAHWCLSVFFLLSFYLLSKFLFHLFLIPAMVPDDDSMNDPLCNSAIGSMVTFDCVTPDTSGRCFLGIGVDRGVCVAVDGKAGVEESLFVFSVAHGVIVPASGLSRG